MAHFTTEDVQLYLDGTVPAARRRFFEEHIAECDDCRRLLAESAPTSDPRGPGPLPSVRLRPVAYDSYVLEAEIGRGGLGRIFRAREATLGRAVALKELIRSDEGNEARFVREAQITANLQHPAIVPLYEAGRWPTGEPFYTMKLVSGRTLQHLLVGRRSLGERLPLLPNLIAVGEALAYAHAQGVVHRDVKPANVLVGDFGETVLIDWGVAKKAGDAPLPPVADDAAAGSQQTRAGDLVGTPLYMSPEQARGEPADARSDVYALGLILYELLAGSSPYLDASRETPESASAFLQEVRRRPIQPVELRVPDAPPDLVTIVRKAMAPEPDDRYPTAKELVEDLTRFQAGQLVSARRYTAWELVRRWVAARRALVATGAAALVVVVAVAAIAFARVSLARRAAEESVTRLHREQGRLAHLAGDPMGALVHLSAALASDPDDPQTRFLARRATDALDKQVRVFAGHQRLVHRATFSPDGALIATASVDGSVRLWDVATGATLRELRGHQGSVNEVAWSPDGSRLLSAGIDGTARLWDASEGRELLALRVPGGRVESVGFSHDGRALIAAGEEGVSVWDTVGGAARASYPERRAVWAASRDGLLAVGGSGRAVLVLDLGTGAEVCRHRLHTKAISALAFSPDGTLLASGSYDARGLVVDARTCRPRATLSGHGDALSRVAFDTDGKRVGTSSYDGTARVWNAASGELLALLAGHGGSVRSIAFTPDGARAVTAGEDRTARVYALPGGRVLSVLVGHTTPVRSLEISRAGDRVLTAGDDTARLWRSLPDGQEAIVRADAPLLVGRAAGDALAALSQRGDLWRWRAGVATRRPLCPDFSPESRVFAVPCDLSPDGKIALRVTGNLAEALDTETGEVVGRAAHPGIPGAIQVGNETIVTGCTGGLILRWEARGGRVVSQVATGEWIGGAGGSTDGRRVAAAMRARGRGMLSAWDAAGRKTMSVAERFGRYNTVVFDPAGERVAATTREGGARIYASEGGRLLATLEGYPTTLANLAFSPDGRWIAASGEDGTTRIYEAGTGVLVHVVAHGTVLYPPIFDRDRLITVGGDGALAVWSVGYDARDPAALAAFVRCRVPYRLIDDVVWPAPVDREACR